MTALSPGVGGPRVGWGQRSAGRTQVAGGVTSALAAFVSGTTLDSSLPSLWSGSTLPWDQPQVRGQPHLRLP